MWNLLRFGLTFFCQQFCESNVLTKEITKESIWRNICLMRPNSSYFHAVHCNFRNLLSRIFGKKFVKATVLLKKLLKRWFNEIFFQWEQITHFTTLCTVKCKLIWRKKLPQFFFFCNYYVGLLIAKWWCKMIWYKMMQNDLIAQNCNTFLATILWNWCFY